jgi:hypothetical protein
VSAHHFTITIGMASPHQSGCKVSIACDASPTSAAEETPTCRPMRVPPACVAHSLARRRTADALHVVGREQAGAA